jgi:hypothetical protein
MEIDQQLEQRINIKFLVKMGKVSCEIGQEWPQNSSNVATGLWRVCTKGKNCFQVGPMFSGRL